MEGMISTGEKQWRHEFMTLHMRDLENIEKGREEGRQEGLLEGRQEGLLEGREQGRRGNG